MNGIINGPVTNQIRKSKTANMKGDVADQRYVEIKDRQI